MLDLLSQVLTLKQSGQETSALSRPATEFALAFRGSRDHGVKVLVDHVVSQERIGVVRWGERVSLCRWEDSVLIRARQAVEPECAIAIGGATAG